MFKIELGSKVKSNITGYTGIVTSRSEHLNGCDRYWVQAHCDKDGKIPDGYWFDDGELEIIGKSKLTRKNRDNGGFHSTVK